LPAECAGAFPDNTPGRDPVERAWACLLMQGAWHPGGQHHSASSPPGAKPLLAAGAERGQVPCGGKGCVEPACCSLHTSARGPMMPSCRPSLRCVVGGTRYPLSARQPRHPKPFAGRQPLQAGPPLLHDTHGVLATGGQTGNVRAVARPSTCMHCSSHRVHARAGVNIVRRLVWTLRCWSGRHSLLPDGLPATIPSLLAPASVRRASWNPAHPGRYDVSAVHDLCSMVQ
jgi:hypothetical protein